MSYVIFDIETDGLREQATKIHCLCYMIVNKDLKVQVRGSMTTLADIDTFTKKYKSYKWVCHNLIRFDVPVLEDFLERKLDLSQTVCTLALSWYLYPDLTKKFGPRAHGLDAYGSRVGVAKPVVTDWKSLTTAEYIHRCTEDVEINYKVFVQQYEYLLDIYDNNEKHISSLINYLGFKMDCLREQEEEKCYINLEKVEKHREFLEDFINKRKDALEEAMPDVVKYKDVKYPGAKLYKKNGDLSVAGSNWYMYLTEEGLPMNHIGNISVVDKVLPPNADSHAQMKDWLFSLGWVPKNFKLTFPKSHPEGKQVPQIQAAHGDGLCESIKKLFVTEPALESLDQLSVASHRYGIIKAFASCVDENSKVVAGARGFTQTLRLKHAKPVVNLPKPSNWFGGEIRECICIEDEDNYIMCGSDVSGLESATADHYMFNYDPKYVQEKRTPGFDAHTDIAKLAGLMSLAEETFFKKISDKRDKLKDKFNFTDKIEEKEYKRLKKVRGAAKTTNFAATYGAGGKKIAETLEKPEAFGRKLHKTYWKRNWSIKEVAKNARVKKVRGQAWIFNPTSKYWYFLKADKDRFSAINQSSGVYVVDLWISEIRKEFKGTELKIQLQYHDELLVKLKKDQVNYVETTLQNAMKNVNKNLKLNVVVGISAEFGMNYKDVH